MARIYCGSHGRWYYYSLIVILPSLNGTRRFVNQNYKNVLLALLTNELYESNVEIPSKRLLLIIIAMKTCPWNAKMVRVKGILNCDTFSSIIHSSLAEYFTRCFLKSRNLCRCMYLIWSLFLVLICQTH